MMRGYNEGETNGRVFHVEKHTKNCNVEQQALTTIFVSLLFKVHITSKIIFHKKQSLFCGVIL